MPLFYFNFWQVHFPHDSNNCPTVVIKSRRCWLLRNPKAYYPINRFRPWTLLWAGWIHATPSDPIRDILILLNRMFCFCFLGCAIESTLRPNVNFVRCLSYYVVRFSATYQAWGPHHVVWSRMAFVSCTCVEDAPYHGDGYPMSAFHPFVSRCFRHEQRAGVGRNII